MENRTTGPARALAALALVAAFMAVVIVFATTLGGDDDGGSPSAGAQRGAVTGQATPRREGAGSRSSYVVQNGDTLTSIAAKTGVSIERIQALNPGIDPQILVSGQKLKLR